jgi:putative ABC transport system permease protein
MIRHLLKLVWNRKRSSLLVMIEIFVSFLILFSVVLLITQAWGYYSLPMGFDYRNVWDVTFQSGASRLFAPAGEDANTKRSLIRELMAAARQYPQVLAVAGAAVIPYGSSNILYAKEVEGVPVTDSFKDVMGLTLLDGRWFREDDDQLSWQPVVINELLARERFGSQSPLGRRIELSDSKEDWRVIGVVQEFRKRGEYDPPAGIMITRSSLEQSQEFLPEHLLLKVQPGVTAAFEETLLRSLRAVAPKYSFKINALESLRDEYLRTSSMPWIAGALVAGFLLLMVGMGLNGVLWQSVTRRNKEIGLRRAHGATAIHIYAQVLGEILLMATLSMLAGWLIVIQLPITALFGFIPGKVYATSMILSTLIIYLLSAFSALYPAWLAARVRPAEALHWE